MPIERVSIDNAGNEGNNGNGFLSLSADGRFVTFSSGANNLVAGDTNNRDDIFVYDRQTDTIERVSIDNAGGEANDFSSNSGISADGRFVTFSSGATNLVTGDTNGFRDIFIYDRQTDTIERVSLDNFGNQGNASSNVSFVGSSISADGRFVAFESNATNLVTGDTNGAGDIFVYDRTLDTVERVSIDNAGTQGDSASLMSSISADGRFVAFESFATNLVAGDTNGQADIFVYDRQTDMVERVSVGNAGNQGDFDSLHPSISADGRFVAFDTRANGLVPGDNDYGIDVYVYDRQTDTIERVSIDNAGNGGNNSSQEPSISADGRFVTFWSRATNLVPGDTNGAEDIFVYDRQTDTIQRVSVNDLGVQGNGNSNALSISASGGIVGIVSGATNFVLGDTNGARDVFATGDIRFTGGDDNVQLLNDPTILAVLGTGETVDALDGNDTVTGGASSDTINGGLGNDTLNGGAGNDTLDGGLGADILNGGADTDTADYSGATNNQTINLVTNANTGGFADGDTLNSVENVIGSNTNLDRITGDAGANTLSGMGADDFLRGYHGDDTLNGGEGNDFLFGGLGADTFNGGNGLDWAMYNAANAAVTVNLATGGTVGEAAGDSYNSIERVRGSTFDDTITGDNDINKIFGDDGNDTLNGMGGMDSMRGGNGNDRLDGGAGNDSMFGEAGNDTFFYGTGSDHDYAADFENDIDTLEFDDALWGGGLTETQFVDAYITMQTATRFYFNFLGGNAIHVITTSTMAISDFYDDVTIV